MKWSAELARLEGMILRQNSELGRVIRRQAQLEQAMIELSKTLAEPEHRPLPSGSGSAVDPADDPPSNGKAALLPEREKA